MEASTSLVSPVTDLPPRCLRPSASDASGSIFAGSVCSGEMEELGPRLEFELDFDLRALRASLATQRPIDESGYQSVLARSCGSVYGTGWLMADTLSLAGDHEDEDWDGYMEVGSERVRITDMADLLATRFAFLTGAKGCDGVGVVSFPDVRTQLSFPDYRRVVTYLLAVPAMEESHCGYVIVADRRGDKWASVKTLLLHLSAYFPGNVRVVFIIKPEGVIQRALELGYKTLADDCNFKVVICQNIGELHRYIERGSLTVDFAGCLEYNHLEWVQHRMDIERLKSSAGMIANSLEEFSRCLRDTELPNDAATTTHILNTQLAERDAIREEFRIAVRRGQALLSRVRQVESTPRHTELSPTRLGNVTAIQRMLVQLDETERSFDAFWTQHQRRLSLCLDLRRFEEDFRRLQSLFAGRMLHLEEHREVGESAARAEELLRRHRDYTEEAAEEMEAGEELEARGRQLCAVCEGELGGSLGPKCEELRRMADALSAALANRLSALQTSRNLHHQISEANQWCRKGVDLLGKGAGLWTESREEAEKALAGLDDFLASTPDPLRPFVDEDSALPEASTLLHQVGERIADVRSLCETQRGNLARSLDTRASRAKPVQVVTPEKARLPPAALKRHSRASRKDSGPQVEIQVLHPVPDESCTPIPSTSRSEAVLSELLTTEEAYCSELASVVEHYVLPLRAGGEGLEEELEGRVFGNVEEVWAWHSGELLPGLRAASDSASRTAGVFRSALPRLGPLYAAYCQAKLDSDAALQSLSPAASAFFRECQRRAGHPLPLYSYLLKPLQRVSKYHLLLWELAKALESGSEEQMLLESVYLDLRSILDILNASVKSPNISAYPGDVRQLGRTLMEGNFLVYPGRRKGERSGSKLRKPQSRRLFLFPASLVFTKRREPSAGQEYYEFKMELRRSLVWVAPAKDGAKLEVGEAGKAEIWTLAPEDRSVGAWTEALAGGSARTERPLSWASTSSVSSNRSSRDLSLPLTTASSPEDAANNNPLTPTPSPSATDAHGNELHMEKGKDRKVEEATTGDFGLNASDNSPVSQIPA